MHIVYALLLLLLGFLIEVYTFQIVRTFGHLDWAERSLGPGGSYMAWRIIGIIAIVIGYGVFRYKWFLS